MVAGVVVEKERILVSAAYLAKRWSCSTNTVRRIAEREKIACYVLGGERGTVRYDLQAVQKFEDERRV